MAFDSTNWSLVLTAKGGENEQSRAALHQLCETYWPPLYAFLRGKGNSPENSREITQSFFTHLLEKGFLDYVNPERGKFRTFLLVSLNRFLASEKEKASALKRNQGKVPISIDALEVENWYVEGLVENLTPERIYEQKWALSIMDLALKEVETRYSETGNRQKFDVLSPFITADMAQLPYAQIAEELQTSEGAVKVAVHRIRQRYRKAIRNQVEQTLADPNDLEEELQYLLSIFGRR